MAALQWDETGKKENKAQHNDACDASIYARGAITRYISHVEPVADAPIDPEVAHLERILRPAARGSAGHDVYQPSSVYQPK